jgi:stage III sporulation protein AB
VLKLLGSALILAAGISARTLQVCALRRELSVLREMAAALDGMQNDIRIGRLPLPRLLQKAGVGRRAEVRSFFSAVQQGIAGGRSLPETWRAACEKLPLPLRQREAAAEVGSCFCGDEEAACKGILLAKEELERALRDGMQRQADREKRDTALCLSASALLIILLM